METHRQPAEMAGVRFSPKPARRALSVDAREGRVHHSARCVNERIDGVACVCAATTPVVTQ